MKLLRIPLFKNEQGVSALLITLLLPLIFGFIAFGIDLGHLYVVKNELHKAASAGALAGAQFLLNDDATALNTACIQIAHDTAVANMSEKLPVEVWNGDVEIGHWSFGLGDLARGFYPISSPEFTDLWGFSFVELDQNQNFVNAVRVETRRETNQALSFFVRIFNPDFQGFTVRKKAVAYRGPAGNIPPGVVDQPIAICVEDILDEDGVLTCLTGKMVYEGIETAYWTDFMQPCGGASSHNEIAYYICRPGGNVAQLSAGVGTSVNNGVQGSTYEEFRDCWLEHSQDPSHPGDPSYRVQWDMHLPVIRCEEDEESCKKYLGPIKISLFWVIAVEDKHIVPEDNLNYDAEGNLLPSPPIETCGFFLKHMSIIDDEGNVTRVWDAPNQTPVTQSDYLANWNSFASDPDINLLDNADNTASWLTIGKCLYFKPLCEKESPVGSSTGSVNLGRWGMHPVLVE